MTLLVGYGLLRAWHRGGRGFPSRRARKRLPFQIAALSTSSTRGARQCSPDRDAQRLSGVPCDFSSRAVVSSSERSGSEWRSRTERTTDNARMFPAHHVEEGIVEIQVFGALEFEADSETRKLWEVCWRPNLSAIRRSQKKQSVMDSHEILESPMFVQSQTRPIPFGSLLTRRWLAKGRSRSTLSPLVAKAMVLERRQ